METRRAGTYEFSRAENDVITTTSRWIRIFGWLQIVCGAITLIMGLITLPAGVATLVGGGLYFLIGWYLKGAGDSLKAVVNTTGDDLAHLMSALEKLGLAFKIVVIMTLVGLVIVVILAVLVGGWLMHLGDTMQSFQA